MNSNQKGDFMNEKRRSYLDEAKLFYDVYDGIGVPGMGKGLISLPPAIKKAAKELDGKKISIRGAIKKLQSVTGHKIEVVEKYNYIALIMEIGGGAKTSFRVIRYI